MRITTDEGRTLLATADNILQAAAETSFDFPRVRCLTHQMNAVVHAWSTAHPDVFHTETYDASERAQDWLARMRRTYPVSTMLSSQGCFFPDMMHIEYQGLGDVLTEISQTYVPSESTTVQDVYDALLAPAEEIDDEMPGLVDAPPLPDEEEEIHM